MAVEATVAIASGIAAHSITLIAFGLDSVIELASAGVLIWRLSSELRFGREVSEGAKELLGGSPGGLLFAPGALCRRGNRLELVAPCGRGLLLAGLAIALLSPSCPVPSIGTTFCRAM